MEGSLRMLGLDPDDFPTFDFEHVLEVDELTVIHNDRLGRETVCSVRDAFRDLLTDADIEGSLASDAREDGLRDATEDIETDVSL